MWLLFAFALLPVGHCSDTNVGTVLFTRVDAYRECWSSENLAILTTRMILEDLLPSPSILVIDCDEFVMDLVEYFRLVLETVREVTHGKTKHITLVALADLLGGYLQHAVLPVAKYSFYSGLINHQSVDSLLTLYEELKTFLRTNGRGWARPIAQNLDNFEVPRIALQNIRRDKASCENLILVENDESVSGNNNPMGPKSETLCNAIVPLPFFDSNTRPSAVALPTKSCPLHSLEANSSSYLLMTFFMTSYQCLLSRNAKADNMAKFENDMSQWIENQIMPRLDDEKFYAAFGGILRVRLTLRRLGVSQKEFSQQVEEFKKLSMENDRIADEAAAKSTEQPMSKSSMILMAVLITIFLWFILGVSFICYRMRAARVKKDEGPINDDDDDRNRTTTCSSLSSSKYFYPEKPKKERKRRLKCGVKTQSRERIRITTCNCEPEDTEGELDEEKEPERLNSITEMSEQSSATPQQTNKRGKKVAIGGSSTADGSSSEMKPHQVNSEVYQETSETEDTTTEGA